MDDNGVLAEKWRQALRQPNSCDVNQEQEAIPGCIGARTEATTVPNTMKPAHQWLHPHRRVSATIPICQRAHIIIPIWHDIHHLEMHCLRYRAGQVHGDHDAPAIHVWLQE